MSALTDALDSADREIELAKASLDEAKWQMILLYRAPEAERPEVRRELLAELDRAVGAATAARRHLE